MAMAGPLGCELWTATAVVLAWATAVASTSAATPPFVICLAATRSANTAAASCTSLFSTLSTLSPTLGQAVCSDRIPAQLGSSGPPGPPDAATTLIFACLNTTSFSTYARLTAVTWSIASMKPSSTFLQRFDAQYTSGTPPYLWLYYSNTTFRNMPSSLSLASYLVNHSNPWVVAYFREIFLAPPPPSFAFAPEVPSAPPPPFPVGVPMPPSPPLTPPHAPSFPNEPTNHVCTYPTEFACNGSCYGTCETGQEPLCSDQGSVCCPAATPVPCVNICLAPGCICCLNEGQPSCCASRGAPTVVDYASYSPMPATGGSPITVSPHQLPAPADNPVTPTSREPTKCTWFANATTTTKLNLTGNTSTCDACREGCEYEADCYYVKWGGGARMLYWDALACRGCVWYQQDGNTSLAVPDDISTCRDCHEGCLDTPLCFGLSWNGGGPVPYDTCAACADKYTPLLNLDKNTTSIDGCAWYQNATGTTPLDQINDNSTCESCQQGCATSSNCFFYAWGSTGRVKWNARCTSSD